MSKYTEAKYNCDNCGKKLPTYANNIDIVTDNSGDVGSYWTRLHVKIEHHHGVHNNGETDQADLCKGCVITLLKDALKRVMKGERVSAGVETSDMLKFNQPF